MVLVIVYACVWLYSCICEDVYSCAFVYLHICILQNLKRVHLCLYTCSFVEFLLVCVYMLIYVCAYKFVYVYTCTFVYVYTCACEYVWPCVCVFV